MRLAENTARLADRRYVVGGSARGFEFVIDRTYPLEQVPEALRYLEEGHARGKSSSRSRRFAGTIRRQIRGAFIRNSARTL